MFAKLVNPFNKVIFFSNATYLGAVEKLLDLCNDKDDQVKAICEASLVRISSRNPNEVINFIIQYKKKNSKIHESIVGVILR